MPRTARKNINAHFIHVMVQGLNREYIFDDRWNLNFYLKCMKSESRFKEFDLLAYCMMNNHAHFLFHVDDLNCFGQFMKGVNQSFATFYNLAGDRVGVVFRNRYQVEPIHDLSHLKNCIKYIHDNPVKAGIVGHARDYPFSSYHEFLNKDGCGDSWVLKKLFGENTDILDEVEKSDTWKFMDFEKYSIDKDFFETGIRLFKKKNNCSLIEIMSERETMLALIKYLKNDLKIKYKESINYFSLPRGILNHGI